MHSHLLSLLSVLTVQVILSLNHQPLLRKKNEISIRYCFALMKNQEANNLPLHAVLRCLTAAATTSRRMNKPIQSRSKEGHLDTREFMMWQSPFHFKFRKFKYSTYIQIYITTKLITFLLRDTATTL